MTSDKKKFISNGFFFFKEKKLAALFNGPDLKPVTQSVLMPIYRLVLSN